MRFAMRLRKANTSHVQSHIYEVGANQSHYLVKYRLWLFKQFQEWNWLFTTDGGTAYASSMYAGSVAAYGVPMSEDQESFKT